MNMFARFDENPAMTLQGIKETKRYRWMHGRTHGQRKNSIPTTNKVCRGYNNINEPQKKHYPGTVSENILLEGLNQFNGAPTSPLVQTWIKTHRYLVCMKDT